MAVHLVLILESLIVLAIPFEFVSQVPEKDLSMQEVLMQMRAILGKGRYTQVPQLSSSRPLDVHHKFDLVPDNFSGTRRAVLIGINYVGQNGELSGCQHDVKNILKYIKDVHKFQDQNIQLLLDDGQYTPPTRENILNAYRKVAAESKPGDAIFCHYSGHGGKVRDDDGDEKDGFDETLVPVSCRTFFAYRDLVQFDSAGRHPD